MSAEAGSNAQHPGGLKGLLGGFLGSGPSAPRPIKTHSDGLRKQDSLPEIVMTPSDIGVHETSHSGLRGPDGKLDWRRVFRTPARTWENADDLTGAGTGSPASPQ